MLPTYASREVVKAASDVKSTARLDAQVDRAIAGASRDVEGDLRRRFYPEDTTFTFRRPRRRQLFLDNGVDVDLVSVDSVTVDGTVIAAADFDLLSVDGPPFTRIEFADTISFGTGRRPIQIAGTWGYDDRTAPAGKLAAAVADTTTTMVDVTNSAAVGVGDVIIVDTERMIVAEKTALDTTQDLAGGLSASVAEVTVTVVNGTAFSIREVLLVDVERMLIVDIAGNNLTVKRAWDGSVLAAHSLGASIFALRRLTVERGALGTTAATHVLAAAVARQVYPGPVVAYTVALAEQRLFKEISGQGGEVGGRGVETTIDMIRADARRGYQRLLLG